MEKERFDETKREIFGNDNLLIGKNDKLIVRNVGKWLTDPKEVNNPLNVFSSSTYLVKLFSIDGDNIVQPINDQPLTITEVLNMYKKAYGDTTPKEQEDPDVEKLKREGAMAKMKHAI